MFVHVARVGRSFAGRGYQHARSIGSRTGISDLISDLSFHVETGATGGAAERRPALAGERNHGVRAARQLQRGLAFHAVRQVAVAERRSEGTAHAEPAKSEAAG